MLGFRVLGSHREKKLALVAGEGLATWRRAAAVASVVGVAVATGGENLRILRFSPSRTTARFLIGPLRAIKQLGPIEFQRLKRPR